MSSPERLRYYFWEDAKPAAFLGESVTLAAFGDAAKSDEENLRELRARLRSDPRSMLLARADGSPVQIGDCADVLDLPPTSIKELTVHRDGVFP